MYYYIFIMLYIDLLRSSLNFTSSSSVALSKGIRLSASGSVALFLFTLTSAHLTSLRVLWFFYIIGFSPHLSCKDSQMYSFYCCCIFITFLSSLLRFYESSWRANFLSCYSVLCITYVYLLQLFDHFTFLAELSFF